MDQLTDKNLFNLDLTEETKSNLSTASQWMNYTAIIGLISAGITIVSAVIVMGKYGSGSSMASSLIGLGISVLLNLTLMAAAKNIKSGIAEGDQGVFTLGLSKLANYFKILGIIVIICLVLFGLVFLFMLAAGGAARGY